MTAAPGRARGKSSFIRATANRQPHGDSFAIAHAHRHRAPIANSPRSSSRQLYSDEPKMDPARHANALDPDLAAHGFFPGFTPLDATIAGVRFAGVIGGSGPPLLLLHGYPETCIAWRRIAPDLAKHFTVIAVDLPGYGDSNILAEGGPRWGKRRVAAALADLMGSIGHRRFLLVGHDRGARAGYRLALDHPHAVAAFSSLTVVPTLDVWPTVNRDFARKNFHWFLFAQPASLPETLLQADPDAFIDATLQGMSGGHDFLEPAAIAHYRRAFRNPAVRHAICEDYRAAITEDTAADEADRASERRIECPVQILWSTREVGPSVISPIETWDRWASDVTGKGIDAGHLLPEETPGEVLAALSAFLRDASARWSP